MSINQITPYKNRQVNFDMPVDVYRCLNRKGRVFSIKQNSLVVAHCTQLEMKDVEFVVNKAGKKKAIASKRRNVHAFIRGLIGSSPQEGIPTFYPLKYNPFSQEGFCIEESEVNRSPMVAIREHGIYAMKPL